MIPKITQKWRKHQNAAQKLIGQIERPKTSVPEIIVVEGEVYEGGSVGNIE